MTDRQINWTVCFAVVTVIWILVGLGIYDARNHKYHVVKIQEGSIQKYAIENCYGLTGCRIYGYRWDVSDEGLKQADKMYHDFADRDQPVEVVEVVE